MKEASITVLTLILALYAQAQWRSEKPTGDEIRDKMVNFIIQRVVNVTKSALAASSPERKEKLLAILRMRLDRISKAIGPMGDKYAQIVMEGVQATAGGSGRRTGSLLEPAEITNNKNLLVRAIAQKIKTLATGAFKTAKNKAEREEALETIKSKIIGAAQKHNVLIQSKDKSVKSYSQLVIEGLELVMKQGFGNDTDRRSAVNLSNPEIGDDILGHKGKNGTSIPQVKEPQLDMCGCSCIIEKTCAKIAAMNKFTCSHGNKVVTLDKLCDGIPDCPDRSDEKQCAKNAIKKLRSSSNIIADIEAVLPRQCLKTSLERDVLTTQNVVLNNVLQQQVDFMNRFEPSKMANMKARRDVKEIVSHVGVVVSTVSLALLAAFCSHERDDIFTRRVDDDVEWELDELLVDRSWAPPQCTCAGRFCAKQNCSSACENTCWQRYTLSRWSCPAVTAEKTISLDLICDGKIDCFDESDETGCSTGNTIDKFEARDTYNIVLKVLSSQVQLSEYVPVLNKFNALQDLVKDLLSESTKERVDVIKVKRVRNKCFQEMTSIYEGILIKADLIEKMDEAYTLLMAINEKLVGALKRSNAGNERTMQNDQCLCREKECAMPQCTPVCVRACAVKTEFTHYSCQGANHTVIPLESICNGKEDCPNADDEGKCVKDICRNHHLLILRNVIQNLKIMAGGSLGDKIKAWKDKVISDLLVKEKIGRSTRRVLLRMVNDATYELMMTYASTGESRRVTKFKARAEDFLALAEPIKEVLRTCSN